MTEVLSRQPPDAPHLSLRGRAVVDPAVRMAAVIATVTDPADTSRAALRRLPAEVTGLVIRADLVGDLDAHTLRRYFPGMLVYSLRSQGYGGRAAGSVAQQHARLLAAARTYDIVELEADRDLSDAVLARIPADQRCVLWRGSDASLVQLRSEFDRMSRVPAWLYVLAPDADSSRAALVPLQLLKELGRADVTAYGVGPDVTWTRIVAPWLGASVVFGHLAPPPDGQPAEAPTVKQLLVDYGYPALPPLRDLYGIAARSTNTTLFLRRLNAAYRRVGLPALMLPFRVPDATSFRTRLWPDLADGLDDLGLRLRGLTVAAPSKEISLHVAGTVSQAAQACGSANLLLRQSDGWQARTTDGTAVLPALREAGLPAGAPVAVVGCGGTGRAMAAVLRTAGADVTLVNRGETRGRYAARLLDLPFVPLASFDPALYRAVVHATSALTDPPFDAGRLAPGAVLVDFVCASEETPLTRTARRRRLTVIDGHHVLVRQAARQFELMTGEPWPWPRA